MDVPARIGILTAMHAKEDTAMTALVGDRLVIHGHRQGEPSRDAEVIEVLGEHGEPPFRVRWEEDGHVSLLFPGSDATVEHIARPGHERTGRA